MEYKELWRKKMDVIKKKKKKNRLEISSVLAPRNTIIISHIY